MRGYCMAKNPDKTADDKGVVDGLLTELGVDDEMRQELIDSGRMSSDVMRVQSAEQVRRRTELETSSEQVRDSISLLERNILTVDGTIDRIERDLVPVVLSFLVGLKGNLVSMRSDIVSQSKRKAKTNLQSVFIDTVIKDIVENEFTTIEDSLTTGMSTPILEKMRDITDGMKESMKLTFEEFSKLKGDMDDYTQRATTEIEHLSTKVGMKPRIEVPKEIEEKLKNLERNLDEIKHELSLENQKLENRLKENDELRKSVAEFKVRNDDLEDTLMGFQAAPKIDQDVLIELKQNVKSLEAFKEVQDEKIKEVEARADASELKSTEFHGDISRKEVEIGDLKTKIRQLEEEMSSTGARLAEMEELRARVRSFESGDKARELERIKTELERTTASLERITVDHEENKVKLTRAQDTIDGYMGLMDSTEKTKAYLMVEEHGEMAIREIARALGVAPAIVMKWAEEFQTLGIAWVVDGTTLVHRDNVEKKE